MLGMTTVTAASGDDRISVVSSSSSSSIIYQVGQKQYASNSTGSVSISVNGDNYEGTFSGTLVNSNDTTDTITITDGELKVKKN